MGTKPLPFLIGETRRNLALNSFREMAGTNRVAAAKVGRGEVPAESQVAEQRRDSPNHSPFSAFWLHLRAGEGLAPDALLDARENIIVDVWVRD